MKVKKRTFSGTTSAAETPREIAGREISCRAAAEGIVLLKNENHLLPLAAGQRVALFGSGAEKTVKGGTGSGDVNERHSVNILEGLESCGFAVTSRRWLSDYNILYDQARIQWRDDILSRIDEDKPGCDPFAIYSTTPFQIPAGREITNEDAKEAQTDTAFYVISRVAGEGKDRSKGQGDWLLSDEEVRNIKSAAGYFSNLILILNAGGPIELSILDSIPQIKAVLFIAQAGMEGGTALGQVLTGQVNPSGKLTDSWAFHYEDYPNAATFSYCNGDVTTDKYEEGIFVGYRYFETFHKPVRFPFGYGQSYTTFRIDQPIFRQKGPDIEVNATVTNTGGVPGREVVQIYAACPQNGLVKERKRLCGFAKTALLQPGESETVDIRFPLDALLSFDEAKNAYMLEMGLYGLLVGNSSADTTLIGALRMDETTIYRKVKPICPLQTELDEIRPDADTTAQYAQKMQDALTDLPILPLDTSMKAEQPALASRHPLADELAAKMTLKEIIPLLTGKLKGGPGSNLGSAGILVPGSAGETVSVTINGVTCPEIVLADGPAGVRLASDYLVDSEGRTIEKDLLEVLEGGIFSKNPPQVEGTKYYQYCTAIPVGTLLAQTWDTALVEEVGAQIGDELNEFSVTLWLAPGMNIHRNPLCGRNFEYYSEDPVVSGMIAAAMTKGVQSRPGVGTTIKHFACNNQEDNRIGSNSVVSQRALREIYLRGFEIAVKTAQPMSIMTSYNLINGVHTANSRDLCTETARQEWNFQGLIMTDWFTTNPEAGSIPWRCITAGNDLIMPGIPLDHDSIRKALESGELTEEALRTAAANILNIVLQSNQFEDAAPYTADKFKYVAEAMGAERG